MSEFIDYILPHLMTANGPEVVILMLTTILIFFWFERKRLMEDIVNKDKKLDKIIEDYQEGNTTLTDAFTQLRIVLAEIKASLSR